MISCVVMLLGAFAELYGIYTFDRDISDINFPSMQIHLTDYLAVIGFTIVALIGIHGVYTRDARYLKVVSIKQTLNDEADVKLSGFFHPINPQSLM